MIELRGNDIIVQNYEEEVISMKDEINSLRIIIHEQQQRISKLEESSKRESLLSTEKNTKNISDENIKSNTTIIKQLNSINSKINELQQQRRNIVEELEMLKEKTPNQDEVSALLSTYEVFSTASRQRIIEVEKTVQSLSETQSEDILPKLEEIEQLRKLCEEINTYSQEEMDKVTHHEPFPKHLPLGRNTQTFDIAEDRREDEKNEKEPLELGAASLNSSTQENLKKGRQGGDDNIYERI